MRTALLIIDIQNDYFPGGKNELIGSEAASLNAKRLLEKFRTKKMPAIHVRHLSTRAGATYFLPGTAGSEIHANVKPIAGETVIEKHFPNSFRDTPLLQVLRDAKIERLVICGMMTHMCVDSTTRAAFDYGYNCILAHDACATKNLTFNNEVTSAEFVHRSFISSLNGMFAVAKSTNDILEEI